MNHEEEYNVEGYDHAFANEPLFQDLPYGQEGHGAHAAHDHGGYEEETYEDDAEAENFPEPDKKKKPAGEKKQVTPVQIALAAVVAVLVACGVGYVVAPDMVTSMVPGSLLAMVGMGPAATGEPSQEPAVGNKMHHKHKHGAAAAGAEGAPADATQQAAQSGDAPAAKPHHRHHAAAVAAGAAAVVATQVAAKPADAETAPKANDPEFKAAPVKKKPLHKKIAAAVAAKLAAPKAASKPHVAHVAHAAKAAALASASGGPGPSTSIGFATGSYWVSAAEIEKLWAYTSHLKANGGQLTVETSAGELSEKRAARVVELIKRNTPPHAYKVTMRTNGKGAASAHGVTVSFSSKL